MNSEWQTEENRTPILEVKGLHKSYTDFHLQDINVTLPTGTIMGFMGRNGAGKSTTMNAIMDLTKPDKGDIRILGMTMADDEVAIKDQIGYVSDTPILNQSWTVERTLHFVRKFYTNWDEALVNHNLERFDMSLEKRISDMSKGMKTKFSFLLATAHQPKLLLLDEPTSGLDPVIREELLDLLLDFMQSDDCSVMFSSHITSDIEKIADVVTFIDDGRILLSEDKESLLDEHRRIVMTDEATYALAYPLLFHPEKTRGGYIGYTADFSNFRKRVKGEWNSERLTLEELFVLTTGRKED